MTGWHVQFSEPSNQKYARQSSCQSAIVVQSKSKCHWLTPKSHVFQPTINLQLLYLNSSLSCLDDSNLLEKYFRDTDYFSCTKFLTTMPQKILKSFTFLLLFLFRISIKNSKSSLVFFKLYFENNIFECDRKQHVIERKTWEQHEHGLDFLNCFKFWTILVKILLQYLKKPNSKHIYSKLNSIDLHTLRKVQSDYLN